VPAFDDANAPVSLTTRWESDSTLIVSIPRFVNASYARLEAAMPSIRAARRVVYDLRGRTPPVLGDADDTFGNGLDALAGHPIAGPAVRQRMQFSATYPTIERGGEVFRPAPNNVVGESCFSSSRFGLPPIAWALRESGGGAIVLDSARGATRPQSSRSASHAWTSAMPDSRHSPLGPGGTTERRGYTDTIVARKPSADVPLRVALELARQPGTTRVRTGAPVPLIHQPRRPHPDAVSRAYRLLAGFRYWNAVHYFYPSEMPVGEDWNPVIEHARPRCRARFG
jgi:hypothetical protein